MAPSQPERRTRYAKAGSVNIAYQVVGDGPVDLMLSFGWVTHLDLAWAVPPLARFLDRLASFSRLIVFDKRGTGLSDRVHPDTLPTLEQRMEDVVAVMDAAGSERAALLGTLGGAAMCGLFAATYPERAAALLLYGAYGKLEPDTGLLARLADTQELALDRVEREWGTEGVGLAFWAPSLLDDEETTSAYLRLTRSGVSPGSARSLMKLGYQIDWEAVLPGIRVPTLILHRPATWSSPSARPGSWPRASRRPASSSCPASTIWSGPATRTRSSTRPAASSPRRGWTPAKRPHGDQPAPGGWA